MEYRERAMSLTSRPDERRREEARIARASQARPLAEPESSQVFHGDNTFSRVTVPNNQLDDISKSVMAILGPYHNVLGGPSVNGPRTSRISELQSSLVKNGIGKSSTVSVDDKDDGVAGARLLSTSSGLQQPQLHPRPTSSSSTAARPLGSSSVGGDSKRPSSLSLSQHTPATSSSSTVTPSKPAKPIILTPIDSIPSLSSSNLPSSSSSHVVVTSSSSPLTQSPVKSISSRNIHMSPRESGGSKELRHVSRASTPPAPSAPPAPPAPSAAVKLKNSSASSRSPKKDANQQQQVPPHSNVSSKPRSSSAQPSSGKTDDRSTPLSSSTTSAPLPSATSKDHTSSSSNFIKASTNSSSPLSSTSVTTSSAFTSCTGKPSPTTSSASASYISSSVPTKMNISSPSRPRSSFANRTHITPSPRPHSTTPTKNKSHLPNGVISQRPKVGPETTVLSAVESSLSSNAADSKLANSTHSPNMASSADKTEKVKSLSLWIPNEKKIPATKSDLIDILKEMAELQAPLTAIETPQNADGEFPFHISGSPSSKSDVKLSQDLCFSDSFKEETKKTTEEKAQVVTAIKKEEVSQTEEKSLPVLPAASKFSTGDVAKEIKIEEKHEVQLKGQKDLPENSSDGAIREASRCSSSGISSTSQTSRHRSIGKTMTDDNSILMRDLDLSEDSDAEPAFEEENSSECQSKKGKVIAPPAGAATTRSVSPMSSSSSSSSSSSDSSSESGADDDDDAEHDDKKKSIKNVYVEPKKSSERRLSSSSSSSSSSSEPFSDDDGNDDDANGRDAEGKKMEDMDDVKTAAERGEKTPSPLGKLGVNAPASLGTPSTVAQENSETSLSWRLDHFMQPKKNTSPASVSPLKSASPPMILSAPPYVQQKDDSLAKTPDQNRPRTLREVGQCETMSFELQAQKLSVSDDDYDNIANDGEDESEVFKRKSKITISSRKNVESPLVKSSANSKQSEHRKNVPDLAASNGSKGGSKDAQYNTNTTLVAQKLVVPTGKELARKQSSSSTSSKQDRQKCMSPVTNIIPGNAKTPSPRIKAQSVRPGSCSSSNDEIDVVSYTPDEKIQHRLTSSPGKTVNRRSNLELSKKLFNGALSESSDEGTKASPSKGKSAENNHKHHRRKGKFGEHPSSVVATVPLLSNSISMEPSATSSSGPSNKPSKKDKDSTVAFGHLEAISKPPNLLSPLHSNYSSPPVASTKPLPPFHSSFSPLHSSNSVMPPYVTLTRNIDGTSRPKIKVQIRKDFLRKEVMKMLKEKRDRGRKTYKEVKALECSKSDVASDSRKESKILSLSDRKSLNISSGSIKSGDIIGFPRNGEQPTLSSSPLSAAHSISSPVSKASKHRLRDNNFAGVDTTSPHKKRPKHASSSSKDIQSSSSSPSSSLLGHTSAALPTNCASSVDSSTTADHSAAVSSQTKLASSTGSPKVTPNKTSSPAAVTPSKTSGSSAVTHFSLTDEVDAHGDEPKLDKTKTFKRKQDSVEDESLSKRNKSESVMDRSGSTAAAATISKRRDSSNSASSKGSHQSTSSKKSRHISISSKKDNSSSSNNIEKTNTHIINGSEKSSLPFNHYVNGNSSSNGIVGTGAPVSSPLVPSNLPAPSPIETQLHSTKHYLARATEHKHHADNLKDKLAKYEPYLRSGLSFFLAGYSMELNKRELTTSYSMYNDTSNLLQYVIRMRANSSSNPESSDRERKLIVLIIRLQAYLNHRLYRLRRAEVSKLKKVIESEQTKYHSSSTTTVSNNSTNANPAVTSKPHAPSPHQTNWNKTSTDTPSPMSPTPSPAGSVSSQGSCELVTGKITNGTTSSTSTPLTSPSPGMVSVHHRVHAVTQKYFILTSHMVKALELWDQADAESRGFEDFFTVLDNACGPLSFHSDPPVVVRYMKHALRLLNL